MVCTGGWTLWPQQQRQRERHTSGIGRGEPCLAGRMAVVRVLNDSAITVDFQCAVPESRDTVSLRKDHRRWRHRSSCICAQSRRADQMKRVSSSGDESIKRQATGGDLRSLLARRVVTESGVSSGNSPAERQTADGDLRSLLTRQGSAGGDVAHPCISALAIQILHDHGSLDVASFAKLMYTAAESSKTEIKEAGGMKAWVQSCSFLGSEWSPNGAGTVSLAPGPPRPPSESAQQDAPPAAEVVTSSTMTLPHGLLPWLIGKGGCHIKELSAMTGTQIHCDVPQGTDASERRDVNVTITGAVEAIAEAKRRIGEHCYTSTIYIPAKIVSGVIGKAGAIITGIRQKSGAQQVHHQCSAPAQPLLHRACSQQRRVHIGVCLS